MGARILLVEDDEDLAADLAEALGRAGLRVERAGLARDALRLALASPFDACILDLGLPDQDGLALLGTLRSHAIPVPVLILTARDALGDRVSGLDEGADDYLTKPFELAELEARLRAMLRRRSPENARWRQFGALRLDLENRCAFAGSEALELTRRELEILERLMRLPGRVVSKEKLLAEVFADEPEAVDNTVEVQVSRLRRKLEAAHVTVRALRGLGYRLEERKAGVGRGEP